MSYNIDKWMMELEKYLMGLGEKLDENFNNEKETSEEWEKILDKDEKNLDEWMKLIEKWFDIE